MKKYPIKNFELGIGVQSYTVELVAANGQFDWLDKSIVSDQSDKRNTTYNSYTHELASAIILSIEIENMTNRYSITIEIKYDVSDNTKKYML